MTDADAIALFAFAAARSIGWPVRGSKLTLLRKSNRGGTAEKGSTSRGADGGGSDGSGKEGHDECVMKGG